MRVEVYRSPWFNLDGYRACTVKYADGTKATVLEHREVLAKKLRRPIAAGCVAHHRNGIRDDNRPSNLEEKNVALHGQDHAKSPESTQITCPECKSEVVVLTREVRHNQIKRGREGPFCGRSCAGRWNQRKQKFGRGGMPIGTSHKTK